MRENSLPYGDPAVDARTDLFRHVNGAWLDSFEIPEDRAGDGTMRTLYDAAEIKVRDLITGLADGEHEPGSEAQKIAALYTSFMDTDTVTARGLDPIRVELQNIVDASSHSELASLLGNFERTGGPGLVGAFVSPDAKESDVYALYVSQAGLHLPDETYYKEDKYAEIREAFKRHVAKVSELADLPEHSGRSHEELAELVMDFETRLAKHHWDRVANRDAEATYNKFARFELDELAEGFDFEAWFGGSETTDVSQLVVSQPSFMTGMALEWSATPLADLKAWLQFGVIESFAGLLPEEFVEESFDFYGRTLSGTPTQRERWKRGVGLVEGMLGEAVGKLYVQQEFPPESKSAIRDLVDKLIRAYEVSITNLAWMGEDTKRRALEKLAKFTPKVGYPDKWREYPAEMIADDLIGNVKRARAAEHQRHIERIGNQIDRTEWLMTPQTVNAYYHPVMNEIVFPAAILQPPFFDPHGSDAANYGAIGAVIGHEIGHGFDDQGSRYDGDGNLVDWWTPADRERFMERTENLIDQFDALVPAGIDDAHHVNGALTVGENIGDLGGLSIAWKALHILAEEQGREVTEAEGREFFYAWAGAWRSKFRKEERLRRLSVDPHSPEEFRCNQIVKNMDAFVKVFDVRPGDPMYLEPEERVSIWS
ncbi:M13 family metallopeptidase [Brevibacterium daeguense]|uniref:M13 family metallopeptidase n=1 Tax=Brevibacterium daeguense TaxID=909936 RepID=A0ABP8EK44_9MICO|nr:M13-type metalloendopeptidase [Brevibacterium daeguense]